MRPRDRQEIFEAKRTDVRNRLRDGWLVSEEMAEAIVAQWEIEAVRRALDRDDPRYWNEAEGWIEERFPRGGGPATEADRRPSPTVSRTQKTPLPK